MRLKKLINGRTPAARNGGLPDSRGCLPIYPTIHLKMHVHILGVIRSNKMTYSLHICSSRNAWACWYTVWSVCNWWLCNNAPILIHDPRHSQVINPKFPPSFSYYVCLFLPSLAFFAPPRYHQYKYCLQTAQSVHFLPSTAYIIGTKYMPTFPTN